MKRPALRLLLAAAAGVVASVALANPAGAALTITSFSLNPSVTTAGGNTTTPGPNLEIKAQFPSMVAADSPKDVTLNLAGGLLANPSLVPYCSPAAFQADNCPSSSQIGSGTVNGTAPQFGTTLNLPAQLFLVQPAGSEIADMGLIATFFDYPVATQIAPINIRNAPDVGINIPITGLPNTVENVPVQINGLDLTITGAIGGQPFTRNPTYCSAATTSMFAGSYGAAATSTTPAVPSTSDTKTSSFTPTGCGSLPYAPAITGTVTKDSNGDGGIAVNAQITSSYNQADSQQIQLTFPFSASPRLGTFLADECTPATTGNPWAGCTSVGTATIVTPLLSTPLTANIYLQQHTAALPTLQIVIPAPFNITLTGTPVLTGTAVQALVTSVPDVPITNLTINLPGGPNSLFLAGVHMCSATQSFGGSFTAWSGATATPSSTATVNGCSSTTTTTATPTGTGTAGLAGKRRAAKGAASGSLASSSTGQVTYSGLRTARPKLVVAVGGGKQTGAIRSVTLRLPAGFSIDAGRLPAGIRVSVNGRSVAHTARWSHGRLTITFAKPGRVAFISVSAPALTVSAAARAHLRGRISLTATLARTTGRATTLRLTARGH